MLVKELLNKIESNEITIKRVAEHYQVSNRTIQNKIKKLGYQWDSKAAKYEYIANDIEPSDLEFETLFRKQNNSKTVVSEKFNSSNTVVKQLHNASNKISKQKQSNSELDIIGELLNSKTKSDKVYKGIYFDSDIASIIDSVGNRQKSELVNQILRKEFTDRGLL